MTADKIAMMTTLLMPGTTSFQRRMVLIGGKLKPRPALSPRITAIWFENTVILLYRLVTC
jgi:hypothetical protein